MRQEPLRKLFSLRDWLMVFGALLMLAGLVSQTPSAQAQDSQQVATLDFSAFDGLGESRELRAERREPEKLSFAAFDQLSPMTAPAGVPGLSFAAFDLADTSQPCVCPAECCRGACCCVDGVCKRGKPAGKPDSPQSADHEKSAHSVDSTADGRPCVWVYKPTAFACDPCQRMEQSLKSGDRELGIVYTYGRPDGVPESYPIIQWRVSGKVHTVHGARTLEQLKAEIAKSRGT